ncbi:MAG: tetratricopeptide repeat protein [Candidatus Brocadiia bacterium]
MKAMRLWSLILAFVLLPPVALARTARRAPEATRAPVVGRHVESDRHRDGRPDMRRDRRPGRHPRRESRFRHPTRPHDIRRRFIHRRRQRDHDRDGLFISFSYHDPPFHISYGYPYRSYSRRTISRSYIYPVYPRTTYNYYSYSVAEPLAYPRAVPERTSLVVIDSPTTPADPQPVEDRRVEQSPAPAETYDSELSAGLGGSAEAGFAFAVGELRLFRGDYRSAAESFREAVAAAPDEPAAKFALALALAGDGDYAPAAQLLRRALRATPDWSALYIDPETVFGTPDRFAAVLERLDEQLAIEPGNGDVRLPAGFLRFAAGRSEEALEVLQGVESGEESDPILEGLRWEARRSVERSESAGSEPAGTD